MPTKIKNLDDVINSARFKTSTNNRLYSQHEIEKIQQLYDYIISIGLSLINGYYNTFCHLVSYDLDNLVDRFDFLRKNNTRRTKETYLARYGHNTGLEKWESYCEKQKVKNLYETKKEKYGWTIDKFNEFNKSRAVTKEKCINRHGEARGLQIWENYVERQRYTNTLDYFEEKYALDGYQKWIEYNQEKSKASSIDWIMLKYSVDKTEALEILSKRNNRGYTSKAELTFIESIEVVLSEPLQYTVKTNQFCIWSDVLQSPCFYDITDSRRMKVIEFNGDYWHCNPLMYESSFYHPHLKMTANNVWEYDYAKIKAATDRGFSLKIVWEADFIKDANTVIKEVVQWWTTT